MAARPLSASTQCERDTLWTRRRQCEVWRVLRGRRALAMSLSCAVVTLLSEQSVYLHYMDQTHFNRCIQSNSLPCSLHLQTWFILKGSVNSSVVLWYDATFVISQFVKFHSARHSTVNSKWYYWKVEVFRNSRTIRTCQITEQVTECWGAWCVKVTNNLLIPEL